jgi:hypothetical protein
VVGGEGWGWVVWCGAGWGACALKTEDDLSEVDTRQPLLEATDALEKGVQISTGEILHDKVEIVARLEAEEELHHKGVVRVHEDVSL